MTDQTLLHARKRARMSQRSLGEAVAKTLGLNWTKGSAQKKISLWEAGGSFSQAEGAALQTVLSLSAEQLKAIEQSRHSHPAAEVFGKLARLDKPSCIAVCYSGVPRGVLNPDVFAALVEGIRNLVSIAFFVPYTMDADPESVELSEQAKELYGHYAGVRNRVIEFRDYLRKRIDESQRQERVGVFCPRTRYGNFIPAPFPGRYALLLSELGDGRDSKELYVWLETDEGSQFKRVGSLDDEGTLFPIENWVRYFGTPLAYWMERRLLPSGSSLGNWRSDDKSILDS